MAARNFFARWDRFLQQADGGIQRGLNNGFAFLLGGKLVASEVEARLRGELEDHAERSVNGQVVAPNVFELNVSPKDFTNLKTSNPALAGTTAQVLARTVRNQNWVCQGPVVVVLREDPQLRTGQLECRVTATDTPTEHCAYIDASGSVTDSGPRHARVVPAIPSPGAVPSASGNYANSVEGNNASGVGYGLRPPAGEGYRGGVVSPPGGGVTAHSPAVSPNNFPGRDSSPAGTDGRVGGGVLPVSENLQVRQGSYAVGPSASTVQHPVTRVSLLLQDGSSRTYLVMEGSNIIGRGSDADFRLPDTGVSRRHAEITWDGHDAVLVDLNSTNGTTVNDIPVDNWLLADGDVITVGHSYIEVRFTTIPPM